MFQDEVMVPIKESTRNRAKGSGIHDNERQESSTQSNFGRRATYWDDKDLVYPSNVLHNSPVTKNTGHSAPFPEWLPEFFINLFTEEGDVVLDPFLGSGTTFRVAKKMNRIPIGIEINPNTNFTLN